VEVVSTEVPIVDFNGDGKVDIDDLLRLIESWGQDDPTCDIANLPFIIGIVVIEDLELLMNCWGQPVDDPTLIAHWALDEAEGNTAHDSVNGNDDLIMGGALWQPAGGMVDGALELDGLDDCLITTFGCNPADGPFSVFAWIKGGAAGQVVLSELTTNWLCTDPLNGKLTTELTCTGQEAIPLLSETVITDGEWYRIGFVWDGLHRTLCVDDTVVAEDMQDGLEGSGNCLYIGVGKTMGSGTFWSGLIDEVRIYNRAVSP